MRGPRILLSIIGICLAAMAAPAAANETTFTYQGSLSDGGAPANGSFDMTFRLYSAASGGSLLGTQGLGVTVVDGVFTAELDFGSNAFNNLDRWLEITVNGTTLSPRQPVTRSPYAITTRGINVNGNGQVGIGGAATTSNMLTIRDTNAYMLLLSNGNDFGPKLTMRNTASGITTVHGQISFEDSNPLAGISYVKPFIGPDGLQFTDSAGTPTMKITDSGLVGIGTLDPIGNLDVAGNVTTSGPSSAGFTVYNPNNAGATVSLNWLNDVARIRIGGTGAGAGGGLDIQRTGNASLFRILHNGNVGIGTTNPTAKLVVNGNARVDVLEVVGADLAERFPTTETEPIEPGMVVEIDPDNPGHMRLATSAYSRLVAGVVSGAGGLPAGTIMGNLPGHEEATPIALSGRVWVLCDTSAAPIAPGDFLTTSDTPGHAMGASDAHRASGAVIGKAMTGLDQGQTGLVLVLVGLQ